MTSGMIMLITKLLQSSLDMYNKYGKTQWDKDRLLTELVFANMLGCQYHVDFLVNDDYTEIEAFDRRKTLR